MTSSATGGSSGTGTSDGGQTWVPSEHERARAAYRRARARRSTLISALSTIAVALTLTFLLTSSPGWPRVQWTYFNWEKAVESFPAVLDGLWLNVRIMVVCGAIIAVFGLVIAIARTLRGPVFFPVRLAGTIYVDLFRGLPIILVLLLLGYGAPALRLQGLPTSTLFWGCVALILSYSAYVAEVFRAGIESVHPSQRAAARSLGLSHGQTLRFVVIPQAVRRVMPPLLNDAVSLQKDSGLISILGVVDAVRAAQIQTASDFNYTPYVVAGVLFIALTVPMARFTDWVGRKQGYQGAGGNL
ncbi:polar amino acid transport system permease protein [Kineosphaera limosa]|uniref:Putative amino acid ABC transporter permease protein n=1 Tax=Kineosphaera limosa NBRC 100340 TaxID=1184609 RepID=K6WM33_9MICO|nr:polar amino acid transport system permease protein [Kineosphaera limosa]GAB94831.1 putative amino acid ABC transporter permease protein [Kineosphaera limosa NBRC 100340]